jgi:hypothetical protein
MKPTPKPKAVASKPGGVASKPAVHSPLPWSGEYGDTLIMDADDITVIELHSRLRKDADMDFILKAVNSHAALVQALKDAISLITSEYCSHGSRIECGDNPECYAQKQYAALKLAGEEI